MDHWVDAASQDEKFESAPSGLCFHDGFTMLGILYFISEVSQLQKSIFSRTIWSLDGTLLNPAKILVPLGAGGLA